MLMPHCLGNRKKETFFSNDYAKSRNTYTRILKEKQNLKGM